MGCRPVDRKARPPAHALTCERSTLPASTSVLSRSGFAIRMSTWGRERERGETKVRQRLSFQGGQNRPAACCTAGPACTLSPGRPPQPRARSPLRSRCRRRSPCSAGTRAAWCRAAACAARARSGVRVGGWGWRGGGVGAGRRRPCGPAAPHSARALGQRPPQSPPLPTCPASSCVGDSSSAFGASGQASPPLLCAARSAATTGSRNASVLPLPVGAMASSSRPGGTGVGGSARGLDGGGRGGARRARIAQRWPLPAALGSTVAAPQLHARARTFQQCGHRLALDGRGVGPARRGQRRAQAGADMVALPQLLPAAQRARRGATGHLQARPRGPARWERPGAAPRAWRGLVQAEAPSGRAAPGSQPPRAPAPRRRPSPP
jgi:hypothetical protein